jgi:hypothetical protein
MKYRPEFRQHVKKILSNCVGKQNAISAEELFMAVTGEVIVPSLKANQTRLVRSIALDIRKSKELPICSGNGYWLAQDYAELEQYTLSILRGAKRKFNLARNLSMVPVSKMIEQYKLNFTDQESTHE